MLSTLHIISECDVTLWSEIQNSRQTRKDNSLLKLSWILIWNMNSFLTLHIFWLHRYFGAITKTEEWIFIHHNKISYWASTLNLMENFRKKPYAYTSIHNSSYLHRFSSHFHRKKSRKTPKIFGGRRLLEDNCTTEQNLILGVCVSRTKKTVQILWRLMSIKI